MRGTESDDSRQTLLRTLWLKFGLLDDTLVILDLEKYLTGREEHIGGYDLIYRNGVKILPPENALFRTYLGCANTRVEDLRRLATALSQELPPLMPGYDGHIEPPSSRNKRPSRRQRDGKGQEAQRDSKAVATKGNAAWKSSVREGTAGGNETVKASEKGLARRKGGAEDARPDDGRARPPLRRVMERAMEDEKRMERERERVERTNRDETSGRRNLNGDALKAESANAAPVSGTAIFRTPSGDSAAARRHERRRADEESPWRGVTKRKDEGRQGSYSERAVRF
eukprot:GEMP01036909.1.p2 GENE.GEMP01036909.1~~GEMP01036909.1.p2  ORF type:complete len:284 (+),score=79.54 GEMP01036909.1:968-1819(+)